MSEREVGELWSSPVYQEPVSRLDPQTDINWWVWRLSPVDQTNSPLRGSELESSAGVTEHGPPLIKMK